MVIKIGHRGCKKYPENTLLSFKQAIKYGVDMIELDVQLSKDKKMVVIHDVTVDRTTGGKGKVDGLTFKEIRKLDAGKGQKVPTLSEVIDVVKGKCKLNIEIKEKKSIDQVLKLIVAKKFVKDALISNSSVRLLRKVKKFNPKIKTALLVCPSKSRRKTIICVLIHKFIFRFIREIIVDKANKCDADIVCINNHNLNEKRIKFFHDKKLKVYVWTINKKKEIQKYVNWGVDGVFTDHPENFVK